MVVLIIVDARCTGTALPVCLRVCCAVAAANLGECWRQTVRGALVERPLFFYFVFRLSARLLRWVLELDDHRVLEVSELWLLGKGLHSSCVSSLVASRTSAARAVSLVMSSIVRSSPLSWRLIIRSGSFRVWALRPAYPKYMLGSTCSRKSCICGSARLTYPTSSPIPCLSLYLFDSVCPMAPCHASRRAFMAHSTPRSPASPRAPSSMSRSAVSSPSARSSALL